MGNIKLTGASRAALTLLRGDRNFHITQLARLTTREQVYQEHPALSDIAKALGAQLTEDTVIELNGMVALQRRRPEEAAAHFLRDHGFIA